MRCLKGHNRECPLRRGSRRSRRRQPQPVPWTSDARLTFYDWLLWDARCGRDVWPTVLATLLELDLPVAAFDLAVDRLHDRVDPP